MQKIQISFRPASCEERERMDPADCVEVLETHLPGPARPLHLHRSPTIFSQRQPHSFNIVYGVERFKEAEGQLEMMVGATEVCCAFRGILAVQHIRSSAIKEAQAIESFAFMPGKIEFLTEL